ncbi:hypothetical protein, partial [Klebsiella aerogenes]|uniref:hypothetical protein n=1 Tax=Klebsiella aerogenes TaxID=548 RepID=UPI0021BAD4E5
LYLLIAGISRHGSFSLLLRRLFYKLIVRSFLLFLQPNGEMGKTMAGMCIERKRSQEHNSRHRVESRPFCREFHLYEGTSHE